MAIQALYSDKNIEFPWCGSQDLIMIDNGCGGFNPFNFQLKQLQLQQLENQRKTNLDMAFNNGVFVSGFEATNNNHPSMSHNQIMAVQVEKQRQEIDHYIRLQNEKLRIMLQEEMKQQIATLLKRIEPKAVLLLTQKDEEIAQAEKRRLDLEECFRKLEAESQAWRRVAQEKGATVVSLNHTLELMRERAYSYFNNGAEDAESCCDENLVDREVEEGTGENRRGCDGVGVGDVEQRKRKLMVCKGCNSRSSSVMFLPCRHLCSCKACEGFLEACPVCRTAKKGSIEALIF
ncbi:E3 ubiquitin-protein ligase BOI [Quillaja saponaria]|uniref:E3 ubiquitin-protein ligase BOI n=1 Tax=Quillaja saponaria TaxID=32244 RepID=A0AAD7PTB8_QUISA|nr:E3 ubiquitin-protein ligase BOI [Quillaja saponaria]